jgi:uncharacterized protein
MGVERQMQNSLDNLRRMQSRFLADAAASGEQSEKEHAAAAAMQKEMMTLFEEEMSWEKTKGDLADVYATTFSDDEMRGLIGFYRSPIGRTFVAKEPELQEKVAKITQARAQAAMPRIQRLLMERFPGAAGTSDEP